MGIRLDREDAVATLTIDRPEARNALTAAMKQELIARCAELANDRDVRAVAIRGAGGKSFASGADITEMATIDSVDGWLEQAQLVEDLYQAIESIRAPTVAVIEGYALGSGLIMALACDLRICTPSARLGAPAAATLGNCLALGEYARIVRILGPTRARQMLLLAMILDAEQALDWGMVTEVVDSERLEARVGEVLAKLAGHAPLSMWATKEALRRLTPPDGVDFDDVLSTVLGSRDFVEGRQAFADRRPPIWQRA